MAIVVRILKANHGDCILISHEGLSGAFNILIDGGPSTTFQSMVKKTLSSFILYWMI